MDDCKLSKEECVPCNGKTPALTKAQRKYYLQQVPDWQVIDGIERDGELMLVRAFEFETFAKAVAFIKQMANIAEQKNHHPTYLHRYKEVRVHFQTYVIKNLSKNDFILAALIDEIVVQ